MSGSTTVEVIRKNETEKTDVLFETLKVGDTFFVDGAAYTVGVDAHYSGDASYDGYLLYDTHENGWFPEDLD